MSNWTHDQLKSLGYHLHPDGSYHPHPPSPRLPDTQLKHDSVKPLVKTPQTQTKGKTRVDLHIQRVSTKLQDFDNYVGGTKPLTDQLRYAGLIRDDDPESISANYTQQKCKHLKDQKTIVTITYHPEALPLQRQAATQSLTSQSSS
jgi:hypothetical protein